MASPTPVFVAPKATEVCIDVAKPLVFHSGTPCTDTNKWDATAKKQEIADATKLLYGGKQGCITDATTNTKSISITCADKSVTIQKYLGETANKPATCAVAGDVKLDGAAATPWTTTTTKGECLKLDTNTYVTFTRSHTMEVPYVAPKDGEGCMNTGKDFGVFKDAKCTEAHKDAATTITSLGKGLQKTCAGADKKGKAKFTCAKEGIQLSQFADAECKGKETTYKLLVADKKVACTKLEEGMYVKGNVGAWVDPAPKKDETKKTDGKTAGAQILAATSVAALAVVATQF